MNAEDPNDGAFRKGDSPSARDTKKQAATTHCYACFKTITAPRRCPDCLNEFCCQQCLNGHKQYCGDRLKKIDPAPKFICPFCGTRDEPRLVQGLSPEGAVATGLFGLLFGWMIAWGASKAMEESHRECSRCGESLEGVPEEGRSH